MYLEKLRLDGRVAVVTGAGQGIGAASARALGEALAQVHTRLAEAFGTRTIAGDAVAEEMRRRLATSLDAAGQLLPYADALAAAFT